MRIAITSKFERILLGGYPAGYPLETPVSGYHQVPVLKPTMLPSSIDGLVAFNDLSRCSSPSTRAVHFYKDDKKFANVLMEPLKYSYKLSMFQSVITPDVTIGSGMPSWMRARNTVLARMVGVVWQECGLNVIPNLRWVDPDDYSLVTCGIPTNSIFAVSNYGTYKTKNEKYEFDRGLTQLVTTLKPKTVLLHGATPIRVIAQLSEMTDMVIYPANEMLTVTKTGGSKAKELDTVACLF